MAVFLSHFLRPLSILSGEGQTSEIVKLSDGRTMLGDFIFGSPTVVIEAYNSGIDSLKKNDFQTALEHFQIGINALESSPAGRGLIQTIGGRSSNITSQQKGQLYSAAGYSAQRLGSNGLANQFVEKAVGADPKPEYKILLFTIRANLAYQKMVENDIDESYNLFDDAIQAYESIQNSITNQIPKEQIFRLYAMGAHAARLDGDTNTATVWQQKAKQFLK